MLKKYMNFINESANLDYLKDYFYDILDDGVKYNLIPLNENDFYIILTPLQISNKNENDNLNLLYLKRKALDEVIKQIKVSENIQLCYSNPETNVALSPGENVYLFNKELIDKFEFLSDFHMDIDINGTIGWYDDDNYLRIISNSGRRAGISKDLYNILMDKIINIINTDDMAHYMPLLFEAIICAAINVSTTPPSS